MEKVYYNPVKNRFLIVSKCKLAEFFYLKAYVVTTGWKKIKYSEYLVIDQRNFIKPKHLKNYLVNYEYIGRL